MVHRTLILAGFGLVAALSSARAQVSPRDLNECTTLSDPAQMQQCVVTGEGARKIRGRLSSPRAPTPNAPIFEDSETPEKRLKPLPGAP